MKIHFIYIVSSWLKYPVNDATVKMHMFIKGRAEAVDESDRAYAGLGVATGAVFAQAPFHFAQKDAQDCTLQSYITLQEIAQALGYREHPLPHR
jgi:hypothetical protein